MKCNMSDRFMSELVKLSLMQFGESCCPDLILLERCVL
jgi:hypothetical protein